MIKPKSAKYEDVQSAIHRLQGLREDLAKHLLVHGDRMRRMDEDEFRRAFLVLDSVTNHLHIASHEGGHDELSNVNPSD